MDHHLLATRLRVPDLAESADHLVAVLGMQEVDRDGDLVSLALPGQPPSLELVNGAAAIESLTLATAAPHVSEILTRAADHGARVLDHADGHLQLMAPHGVVVNVTTADRPVRNNAGRGELPVIGALDHLSFTAHDLEESVTFYCDVLGFRVTDRVGDVRYWLRCNANHHTVALFAGDDGLQHYAFETADTLQLKRLGDALAARDQNFIWGIGRHALGENVFSYHLDPAGAILEVCSDMLQIEDDAGWTVGVWDPNSSASAIRWGQLPPPEFRDTTIPAAFGAAAA
jgi:catechol 2,3-dioxygenase-like lactoylglutathione lyase family enzyme